MKQCRGRGGRRGMREVQREAGKMAEKNKTSKEKEENKIYK
jgi:hypothetical protein